MSTVHRIYTNDVERESLRQEAYAQTGARLSLNRHRTRRSSDRNLTIVAIVAHDRGDRTLYDECREALNLQSGTRLDTTYELVNSRRCSRSRRHGFASNRLLDTVVLDMPVGQAFPLSDVPALSAAVRGSLTPHA
jgi:hypothetical protein